MSRHQDQDPVEIAKMEAFYNFADFEEKIYEAVSKRAKVAKYIRNIAVGAATVAVGLTSYRFGSVGVEEALSNPLIDAAIPSWIALGAISHNVKDICDKEAELSQNIVFHQSLILKTLPPNWSINEQTNDIAENAYRSITESVE